MIFDKLPDEAKQQAMDYYGIQEYPPEDGTCTWKLICGTRRNDNHYSYMVTNGCTAGIFLVSLDSKLDMIPCLKEHFTSPDNQIIAADINENLIFGRFDKFLYKLIPNNHFEDEDTKVIPLDAKVFVNDDLKHLKRERERLKEIAEGRMHAATLDKDQCKNLIYPVFNIIKSYLKHYLCNEYVISFFTDGNYFTEPGHLARPIYDMVKAKTLEQCYEWVTEPGRQVGDIWGEPLRYYVRREWYWHHKWGYNVGQKYWINIIPKLEALNRVERKFQYFEFKEIAGWYEVKASQYVNTLIRGYTLTFNDYDYTDGFSYDNILYDLGLKERPVPIAQDENKEDAILNEAEVKD